MPRGVRSTGGTGVPTGASAAAVSGSGAAHGWLSAQIARIFVMHKFATAFTASLSMIIFTELGDRTFFIAAIMAMKHPRLVVFSGAFAALVLMTVISGVAGVAAVSIIPPFVVNYAVVALMLFFGVQLLRQGWRMGREGGFDELEEVENETMKKDQEEGTVGVPSHRAPWSVALEAFTLTFLAEWGDRSQLATIALCAANSPIGVMLGGILGHGLCTGFAVIGGRFIANYVSEKTVTLTGGALFVMFGLYSLFFGSA